MMREAFQRRAVTMHRMLNDIPGVAAIEPQGAFYCYPNVKGLLGRPLGPNGTVSASTLELADTILGEAKVAFVPGEAFGTPGYARFSFANNDLLVSSSASYQQSARSDTSTRFEAGKQAGPDTIEHFLGGGPDCHDRLLPSITIFPDGNH